MQIIGPAGRLLESLSKSLAKQDKIKVLLYGPPGVGKTTLADALAARVCGKWGIESANGRNVTIHVVREWQATMHTTSLFGDWKVWIVNEVDTMPRDAQDALLTFLDEMPAQRAFIGTSNMEMDQLTERFRTRLLRKKVEAPTTAEVLAYLEDQKIPDAVARQIAATAMGNVRAALLDADAYRNEREDPKPKRAPATIDMMSLLAQL